MNDLLSSTTLFKGYVLKISNNSSVFKQEKNIIKQHKKTASLFKEKDKNRGISTNPNSIITNLSSHVFTDGQYEILQYELKHGLATRPKEMTY